MSDLAVCILNSFDFLFEGSFRTYRGIIPNKALGAANIYCGLPCRGGYFFFLIFLAGRLFFVFFTASCGGTGCGPTASLLTGFGGRATGVKMGIP